MSSSETSTSPTPAKKPRRHPTSRGMRKHVREEKRLGFMENRERRKARLQSKYTKPKKGKKEGSRGKGGGGIQRIWLFSLKFAATSQNLCPGNGCGCLTPGPYVTVINQTTDRTMQVRRCSRCTTLYRDYADPTYAGLRSATSQLNDCAYHCGWQSTTSTKHISIVRTSDAGYQRLCTCSRCGKLYKPYVEASRRDWNDF